LSVSRFVMKEHSIAYANPAVATACLGIGFGFTVPAVNTFAAAFFPKKVDRAVLVLTRSWVWERRFAPVFNRAVFVDSESGGAAVLAGALILGLLLLSVTQTLNEGATTRAAHAHRGKTKFPARFWIFAALRCSTAFVKTMNGNWAVPYHDKTFWCECSHCFARPGHFLEHGDRWPHLFAALEKWFPEPLVCRVLPLGVAAAFVATACVPENQFVPRHFLLLRWRDSVVQRCCR